MQITKINPLHIDQQKNKNRATSNSHDKGLTMLARKKLQLNAHHADTQLLLKNQHKHEQQHRFDANDETMQNKDEIINPLGHSKKAIAAEFMLKEQKDSFMDFLQTQMKNQAKDLTLTGKSNKLKLPQINNTKNTFTHNGISQDEQMNTQPGSTKNSTFTMLKQNPIFINIKAVLPMQKIISSKKKDYSLRDLRIHRKEKQQNQDFIKQGDDKQENQNQKGHRRTMITKKTIKSSYDRDQPLKLTTGQKRRLQRSSMQKMSSGMNMKDKRSFSINQSKKKYASTYQQFGVFIASLNKIRVTPGPVVLYKAFVGKGNNSILIKNVIKNRFWWNIVAQKTSNQQVNFIWAQQKDNQYVNDFECTKIQKNQAINNNQGLKKQKYHLQAKQQDKQQPVTREFTRYGFSKLLSQKQSKQNNFTSLYAQTIAPESLTESLDPQKTRIHNHFEFNWNLTNKKALFYNLKTFYELIKQDPFKYIPLTFHVKQLGDQSWQEFKLVYEEKIKQRMGDTNMQQSAKKKKKDKKQKGNMPLWIIKPGENSNQGCGIQVSDSLEEIIEMVKQKTQTGKNRSSIIQRYLMPFLYCKRKFDIRCYMLVTSVKGVMKGYWYEEGYIRTSSKQFTTKNLKNRMIHLTNDAVQKKGEDYGKYENGNKISFGDFQKYLDNLSGTEKKLSFYKTVYPKMMRLARDAVMGTNMVLDSKNREFTFEVFGLDFMIDDEFETWLIEVNNNPCLQLSSPLLARIIPNMIENAFKIALDPMFPPPLNIPRSKTLPSELFESNKFTLIFNSGDIEEGFKHSITENKVNLDQIVEGQQQDDDLIDDEDEGSSCVNTNKVSQAQTYHNDKDSTTPSSITKHNHNMDEILSNQNDNNNNNNNNNE